MRVGRALTAVPRCGAPARAPPHAPTRPPAQLGCGEAFCKWLALIPLIPTLGLAGLTSIPPRTTVAVFRFGKLDQVYSRPGLTWILPG